MDFGCCSIIFLVGAVTFLESTTSSQSAKPSYFDAAHPASIVHATKHSAFMHI